MDTDHRRPDAAAQFQALPFRSEAFPEDLDGLLPGPQPTDRPADPGSRLPWLLLLPLGVVLIGSASAWVWV